VKRPLVPALKKVIEAAGKKSNELPPPLPEDEVVSPHDIFASNLNTAYEVLQGLVDAVREHLNGEPMKPDYNEIADLEQAALDEAEQQRAENGDDGNDVDEVDDVAEHKEADTSNMMMASNTKKDVEFVTYIDVVNFSLTFKCALQDLDGGDVVMVHIAMYRVEDAQCNLVKFTRLSGSREAFEKTIENLSKSAGEFLTGLTDDAAASFSGQQQQRIEELYKKCFPHGKGDNADDAVITGQ